MRIFKQTNIDFLGKRYLAIGLSLLVIGIGMVSLVSHGGPELGIDFAGGSQIVIRFAEMPAIDDVRVALEAQGINPTIQEFEEGSNELLIRTPGSAEEGHIDITVEAVNNGLRQLMGTEDDGRLDLNTADLEEAVNLLMGINPRGYDLTADPEGARESYRAALQPIFEAKSTAGLLRGWDQVESIGADPTITQVLQDQGRLGGYAIVNSESVGPQVGQDLRRQAIQAVLWALVGMLAYITYRFEFKFGVGAVVALVHDVLIALGAFSLTGREFNLPVIAAFLTIVGYSLNDTVVVFDRIRENTTAMRKATLYERMNASLNQTLSRTLLTSTTTLIVVLALFLYGGPVINDFSFALLIGVVVGTYSSLYIASPVVYEWQTRESSKKR